MENIFVYGCIVAATILAALAVFAGGTRVARVRRGRLRVATVLLIGLYLLFLFLQPRTLLLSDLVVIMVASLVGALLGRGLATPGAIITFVVVAAVVDIVSFSGGLTGAIVNRYRTGESLLLQYLAVSIRLRGEIVPVVGIGDLIILGAIFTALIQSGASRFLAFVVPTGGLLLALLLGLIGTGTYALPFIAVTVVTYSLIAYAQRLPPCQ